MGIKDRITRAGVKAADTVAKLSVLSPEQLKTIQNRRDAYLLEMPQMDDGAAEEMTRRLMAAGSIEIYSEYLKHLKDFYVPVQKNAEYERDFDTAYNIRYFNITKWVSDKKENSLEKLVNVYEVLSNEECNIALVFHRKMEGTEVFLAVTNTQNAGDNVDVENYRRRLAEAIRGNFPGAEWTAQREKGTIPCLKNSFPFSVASASNIPGEKSEKFVSQTIEKLLDGIVPDSREKEYILILLATPIRDVEDRKLHLAELYSALAPYSAWQTHYTYTESDSSTSMASFGVNAGVSAGVQHGSNNSLATTHGTTDSTGTTSTELTGSSVTESTGSSNTTSTGNSVTESTGTSVTNTHGTSSTSGTSAVNTSGTTHGTGSSLAQGSGTSNGETFGEALTGSAGVHVGGKHVGVNLGGSVTGSHAATTTVSTSSTTGTSVSDSVSSSLARGTSETVGQSASEALGSTTGRSIAESTGKALTESATKAVAQNVGKAVANSLGKAVTNSVTGSAGLNRGVNLGGNFGANFARSSNVSATVGKNEGIQQSFTNYTVKHTLEILEQQMKRLEQSTALGMWDFAAYVLSEDQNVASNVAHSYLALTQGESSYMSQTAVNLWRGDMGAHSNDAREICGYLRELRHPIFGLSPAMIPVDSDYYAYPAIVTAVTSLSGKELAYSLNFPQRSLAGFPVLECAEFGRNVVRYQTDESPESLTLGRIFHMNREENGVVSLSRRSLASHTFITGSTGSGKSNTVYQILREAQSQGVHFLVVEPAKGEYKQVFGMEPGVAVFGTNPYISPLLQLNPFAFPKEIHVLEHLDRLVEIFNVCWPMYAAMPAVLKNAVEKSYADCGWDLVRSINRYGEDLYPTFADVARNVKEIIDTSEYDAENKGAYKGSLLTRLQSLTTGIYGMIFTSDELSAADLFDQNVIVDLSRVGSSETKALLMGMMVLKLQEHRMANAAGMNAELKHLTVLEEAHNLLRRTSTEQSAESANLTGKSVEMLANAIAEMRSYGEGFIIVDQAPGLLDMSAIRNTNTKIVMRLPDQGDRELVGRAANLNDDQITELAKLPLGVGAVYQNEWIQPVLCKVSQFEAAAGPYHYQPDEDAFREKETQTVEASLLKILMDQELQLKDRQPEMRSLRDAVIRSRLPSEVKVDFLEYLKSEDDSDLAVLRKLTYDFLNAEQAIRNAESKNDIVTWVHAVVDGLSPTIKGYSNRQINLALALLVYEQWQRDASYSDLFCRFAEKYEAEGGVY